LKLQEGAVVSTWTHLCCRRRASQPILALGLLALALAILGLTSSPVAAQGPWLCHLTKGPRAGATVPTAHQAGPCADGAGSSGQAVQAQPYHHPLPVAAAPHPVHPAPPAMVGAVAGGVTVPIRLLPAPPPAHVEEAQGPKHPKADGVSAIVGAVTAEIRDGHPAAGATDLDSSAPIGTRLFTPPIREIPKGFGAVAILAFPHPPADDVERTRYLAVCTAYVTVLPDSGEIAAFDPDQPQMVTLWPREDLTRPASVKAPRLRAELVQLCSAAVDNYAYRVADAWMSRLPKTVAFAPDARGPFLVAWAPPAAFGKPNVPILSYDLSDFQNAPEFVQTLSLWKNEIEADPSLWRSGWDLTRWRLEAQTLSDRYGERIMAAIKLVPGLDH
jgi:hypothetical protein